MDHLYRQFWLIFSWKTLSRLPLLQLITDPRSGSTMLMTLLSSGNTAKTSSRYFLNTSTGYAAASNSPWIRKRMETSHSSLLKCPDNQMAHSLIGCTVNPPTLTTASTTGHSISQASRVKSTGCWSAEHQGPSACGAEPHHHSIRGMATQEANQDLTPKNLP